jgi:AcrR family transcriptional regulator
MADSSPGRSDRRARARSVARAGIMESARRVAAREGARNLSLRGVAAEAGYAPAALYGYFASKDELLLALAAEDLGALSRAMREAAASDPNGKLMAAASVALALLRDNETMAAAQSALPAASCGSGAARLFNGRMIAALKVLSDAIGQPASDRDNQRDVVLLAAALSGLALLSRSGRLEALGFGTEEVLKRLGERFSP